MHRCVLYVRQKVGIERLEVELPAVPVVGDTIDGRYTVVARDLPTREGAPVFLQCEERLPGER